MIPRNTALIASAAAVLSLLALAWFAAHHQLLLYGDAVAHLHIARRIFDTTDPALSNLGSVWLPLPHLLLVPFVMITPWWQSGFAGAVPSMISYVFAVVALFRLAQLWLPLRWSILATAMFALNPGLLYMQTTAMTEPLFLALFLWSLVFTADCIAAVDAGADNRAAAALLKTGVVLAAAVLSRYDGWVLTAFVGVLLLAMRGRRILTGSPRLRLAAVAFTLLVLAAPLSWMWFNARYFHDPLDFLRGPYSAKAIEARTAVPGHIPHPGYHRPWIAFRYYLRVATLGAARGAVGNFVLVLFSIGGSVLLLRRNRILAGVALLLWFPLPFYTYSVGYGSVPIFMPIWPPNAFYNTRYGMELLPALALFPVAAIYFAARWLHRDGALLRLAWVLAAVNAVLLAVGTPLVLKEAEANSATRIPFEDALAAAIKPIGAHERVLMYASAYAGALQEAGRPLRETIKETDYYAWPAALQDPAAHADYVIAVAGDPVAAAVAAHPQGLAVERIITCQGQPRAILYRNVKTTPR